jgi:hypothetical protein
MNTSARYLVRRHAPRGLACQSETMPKTRVSARSGGKRPRSVGGGDGDGDSDEPEQDAPAAKAAKNVLGGTGHTLATPQQQARAAVHKFFLTVCLQMLKICGFEKWPVEAEGDCSLIACNAGFDSFGLKSTCAGLSKPQRKTLVTQLRSQCVELLTTGTLGEGSMASPNRMPKAIDEQDLVRMAKRCGVVSSTSTRRVQVWTPPLRLHLFARLSHFLSSFPPFLPPM